MDWVDELVNEALAMLNEGVDINKVAKDFLAEMKDRRPQEHWTLLSARAYLKEQFRKREEKK